MDYEKAKLRTDLDRLGDAAVALAGQTAALSARAETFERQVVEGQVLSASALAALSARVEILERQATEEAAAAKAKADADAKAAEEAKAAAAAKAAAKRPFGLKAKT